MATGSSRNVFCGPKGEDVINIICETARRSGVGSEIRRFQIVTRHAEVWDLTVGAGIGNSVSKFVEEWDSTVYTTDTSTSEEWNLTLLTPVKVTIQTQFPEVTEPWEITNQFFHLVGVQEEWNITIYSGVSIVDEEWEIPTVPKHVEEWEFNVVYNENPSIAENWEFSTMYVEDSLATITEENWEITTYLNFAKHADTWAPEIFFIVSKHEEDWELTELISEDSFGPAGFFFEEEWEITEYAVEDSFGPLGVSTVEEWES
jgi:hypothetical protein